MNAEGGMLLRSSAAIVRLHNSARDVSTGLEFFAYFLGQAKKYGVWFLQRNIWLDFEKNRDHIFMYLHHSARYTDTYIALHSAQHEVRRAQE